MWKFSTLAINRWTTHVLKGKFSHSLHLEHYLANLFKRVNITIIVLMQNGILKYNADQLVSNSHARPVHQYTPARPLDQWPTEWSYIRGSPRDTRKTTRTEHNSNAAIHVVETEHHVDFDIPEMLPKYWIIYRDLINAEQWFISHHPPPSIQFNENINVFLLCKKCPPKQLYISDLWYEIINYWLRLN